MSTSGAYQYATGEGGIGLDAMNENIRKFLAGAPTEEATRAAMSQYGVSDEDIRRATGKSLMDYFPGAPTAVTTSPLSLATSQTSAEPVTSALSTLTPTADVSLTPSGTGNLAPIGSEAYRSAIGQGGIGLDAMNQNILNYLATNPTEVAAYNEAKKYGVSQEDIERATGKSYEQIFPETFRPGSVLFQWLWRCNQAAWW